MALRLKVDPQFEKLLPPLTDEEYAQLVENLKASPDPEKWPPIHIWENHRNTILDGHHQYRARKQLRLKWKVAKHSYETRDEALAFAAMVQLGRRNLSASQRAMAAAKLPKVALGDNQHTGGSAKLQTLNRAETVGVSQRSVAHADKVQDEGSAALVAAVEAGDVKVSDAAAIVDIPKKEQTAAVKAVKAGKAKTVAAAANKISGGTSFDVDEIENYNGKPRKSKSGKPIVAIKDRKEASAALGKLVRALSNMGIKDQHIGCLDQIAKAIKS